MRLRHLDAQRVEFSAKRRTRASLWVGVAFVLLGISTATAAATVVHWLTVTASVGFGLCLFVAGWPAKRRAVLDLQRGVARAGQTEIPLDSGARLELSGTRKPDDDSGTPLYRVQLVAGDRLPMTLLEGKEPDRVLASLERTRQAIELPVEAGWGLPSDPARWLSPAPDAASVLPEGIDLRLSAVSGRRRLAGLLFVLTTLSAFLMAAEVLERLQRGDPPTVLGLTLPIASVLILFSIAVAIATYEIRFVTTAEHAIRERRVFGLVVRRVVIDRDRVTGMYPVSPLPGDPLHLLLVGGASLALPDPARVQRQLEAGGDAGEPWRRRPSLMDS